MTRMLACVFSACALTFVTDAANAQAFRVESSTSDPTADNCGDVRVLMTNPEDVQGLVTAICHNSTVISLVSIGLGDADSTADFSAEEILPVGGTLGVVLDLTGPEDKVIPPGVEQHIATYRYCCVAPPARGEPDQESQLQFCDSVLGDPVKDNLIVVDGLSIDRADGLELIDGTFTCKAPPVDCQETVVDFDNPPVPRNLQGVFGGIDWGSGKWAGWDKIVGGCPPRTAYMSCAPEGCSVQKCREFAFLQPSILQSFHAATWAAPGDLHVASMDRAGTILEELSTSVGRGVCRPVETGFTLPAAKVEMCYSLGSDLGIDDLTYCTPDRRPSVCPCGNPCFTHDGVYGVCAHNPYANHGLPTCGEDQCECVPICLGSPRPE